MGFCTETDDHKQYSIDIPDYVNLLLQRLEAVGVEAYLVGGSLRDILLGGSPHDYDLAVSCLPQRTAQIFSDMRVIETGLKHGTVTVLSQGNAVEITTFRIEGSYTDSRHPDTVTFTGRISDDLSRRDFTVNAMAFHPHRGLIDPFGGREDLKNRILRAVGDPNKRFSEDALRIMRAFRFSAQLDFSIDPNTLRAAGEQKEGLGKIARERIAAEFLRLLVSNNPSRAIAFMKQTEILSFVTENYSPDEKILENLGNMPCEEIARLGFYFANTDRETASSLLHRLRLSNKQITGSCAVLFGSGIAVKSPADARKLIASCGIYAPLAVRASILLNRSEKEALKWVEENRAPCSLSDLAVSGKDLIARGIKGKEVGKTLERLLSAVLENPSLNQKELLFKLAEIKHEE